MRNANWQALIAGLRGRIWMILSITAVTGVAALGFTLLQPARYHATATLLIGLDRSFQGRPEATTALERLVRAREIPATFVQIASSRRVLTEAALQAGVDSDRLETVQVQARLIPRSNLLELTVRGDDPDVLTKIINGVGTRTADIVHDSLRVYTLSPVDPAVHPTAAPGPNRWLYVALGIVIGLLLGLGISILAIDSGAAPQTTALHLQ